MDPKKFELDQIENSNLIDELMELDIFDESDYYDDQTFGDYLSSGNDF